ncbi:MAG: kelch repeat-containing protein [Promethearchaeota archaeon]
MKLESIRMNFLIIGLIVLLLIFFSPTQIAVKATYSTWTNMTPSSAPSPRSAFRLAYDNESDKVILFGGQLNATTQQRYDDTWIYNFNMNKWTNKTPVFGPGRRGNYAMAYDSESDRTILFGGVKTYYAPPNPVECWDDTWAYDYNTNTWVQMNPSAKPTARGGAGTVYDIESDRLILFGGWNEERSYLNDIWEYDYNSNNWAQLNPDSLPPARYYPGMAYDKESDRVILFGGFSVGTNLGDTWAFDYNSNSWTNMNPSIAPPARFGGFLAYDAQSDLTILFGGANEDKTIAYSDTWVFDYNTNTWTNLTNDIHPPGRFYIDMTYDYESDVIILFGGHNENNIRLNDTWAFEYKEGTQTNTSTTSTTYISTTSLTNTSTTNKISKTTTPKTEIITTTNTTPSWTLFLIFLSFLTLILIKRWR